MEKETALTKPKEQIIELPNVFDPQADVERATKAAKALMTVIKVTKPLTMNGKQYLYFEHWQTIAKFFNVTVGIEKTEAIDKGYVAKAVIYNKDGVIIGGAEASCMRDELNWKSKPDFQLRSMAQTRAMAKALRSNYGFVAVLAGVEATPAEEIGIDVPQPKISVIATPKVDIEKPQVTKFSQEIQACVTKEELDGVGKRIANTKTLSAVEKGYLKGFYKTKLSLLNVNDTRTQSKE